MIATTPTMMKVTTASLSFSCSSLSQGYCTAGKRPIQVSMYAHKSKALDGSYRLLQDDTVERWPLAESRRTRKTGGGPRCPWCDRSCFRNWSGAKLHVKFCRRAPCSRAVERRTMKPSSGNFEALTLFWQEPQPIFLFQPAFALCNPTRTV